jgi:hypothetical protein
MQRAAMVLTVVLCAAQPGECDSGTYMPATPRVNAPSAMPTASSDPEVTLIELPEAEAWRRVKSTLGTRILVLRPTELPERLDDSSVWLEYAYVAGDEVRYRIGYLSEGATLTFAAGSVNSAPPTSRRNVDVRGAVGEYSTSLNWPERQVQWVEEKTWSDDEASAARSATRYSVQARGITEEELLAIVRGLVAVP